MRIALPPRIDAAALATRDPAAAVVMLSGATMGTTWRVDYAAPPRDDAAGLRARIVARLDAIVGEMSQWEPESALSAYNRAAAGRWYTLPPDFAQVVRTALEIAAASDGAFDPAIGRIVDLWGFGPPPFGGPPAADVLAAARAASGRRRLAFDAGARRLHQPGGLALDLSGIAKGFAVDAVADLLQAAGIGHGLVEIGGELAGRGVQPDGDPWWVALEDPPGVALPPIRIALHGLAVATSGDYRRGAHSIDPRTGVAATGGVLSVSVVADTAMQADGWATALTVLGPVAGAAMAAREGLAARMLWRERDAIREYVSPALAAMLET